MTFFLCFSLWFWSGLVLIPLRCAMGDRCQPLADGGIWTAGTMVLIVLAVGEQVYKAMRGE